MGLQAVRTAIRQGCHFREDIRFKQGQAVWTNTRVVAHGHASVKDVSVGGTSHTGHRDCLVSLRLCSNGESGPTRICRSWVSGLRPNIERGVYVSKRAVAGRAVDQGYGFTG